MYQYGYASKELDLYIAAEVMGYKDIKFRDKTVNKPILTLFGKFTILSLRIDYPTDLYGINEYGDLVLIPSYSTNNGDAIDALDKFAQIHSCYISINLSKYDHTATVSIQNKDTGLWEGTSTKATFAEAACLSMHQYLTKQTQS